MNAILAIAVLIAAVTAREIVRAVATHIKAKDALKALKAVKEAAEQQQKELETKKLFAEVEKMTAETKLRLAEKVSTLNAEQLAVYNRTLDESSRPPVRYMPVYLPYYGYPTSYYGMTQWRGW